MSSIILAHDKTEERTQNWALGARLRSPKLDSAHLREEVQPPIFRGLDEKIRGFIREVFPNENLRYEDHYDVSNGLRNWFRLHAYYLAD